VGWAHGRSGVGEWMGLRERVVRVRSAQIPSGLTAETKGGAWAFRWCVGPWWDPTCQGQVAAVFIECPGLSVVCAVMLMILVVKKR
jgi:hypothetical protein